MQRQKPSGLFVGADNQSLNFAEADYTLNDLTVTVTGLPPAGIILKPNKDDPGQPRRNPDGR